MACIRMRYGNDCLEWTDRTTITSMRIDNRPDDSVFEMNLKPGIRVCDLRNEYPVVFTHDPSRTDEEREKIYAEAKESHDRFKSFYHALARTNW